MMRGKALLLDLLFPFSETPFYLFVTALIWVGSVSELISGAKYRFDCNYNISVLALLKKV